MSEIRNQCFPLSVSRPLDSTGMSKVPSESMGGDCLEEPCGVLEGEARQVAGGTERQDVDGHTGDDG